MDHHRGGMRLVHGRCALLRRIAEKSELENTKKLICGRVDRKAPLFPDPCDHPHLQCASVLDGIRSQWRAKTGPEVDDVI